MHYEPKLVKVFRDWSLVSELMLAESTAAAWLEGGQRSLWPTVTTPTLLRRRPDRCPTLPFVTVRQPDVLSISYRSSTPPHIKHNTPPTHHTSIAKRLRRPPTNNRPPIYNQPIIHIHVFFMIATVALSSGEFSLCVSSSEPEHSTPGQLHLRPRLLHRSVSLSFWNIGNNSMAGLAS